jgi:hypothetical protein
MITKKIASVGRFFRRLAVDVRGFGQSANDTTVHVTAGVALVSALCAAGAMEENILGGVDAANGANNTAIGNAIAPAGGRAPTTVAAKRGHN